MKKTCSMLVAAVLSATFSFGQTVAFLPSPLKQESLSYSQFAFQKEHPHKKRCGITVAGIAATSGGAAVMCAGIGVSLATAGKIGDTKPRTADDVFTAGMFITGAGIGLLIGGLIHDNHQRKLQVVSARKNEVGLAYNF